MHVLIDSDDRMRSYSAIPFVDAPDGMRDVEVADMSVYYAQVRDDCAEFVFRDGTLHHEPTAEQDAAWAALNADPDEDAIVEVAELAASNEARIKEQEDALVELAALIGGVK